MSRIVRWREDRGSVASSLTIALGVEFSLEDHENAGMHWFRRRKDRVEDVLAETVLLDDEFKEVLAIHDEVGARLFQAHGEALSRGDFAEAERIERRIDETEADRAALVARTQAAQGNMNEPSAPTGNAGQV